jgi:hypothetical protein
MMTHQHERYFRSSNLLKILQKSSLGKHGGALVRAGTTMKPAAAAAA